MLDYVRDIIITITNTITIIIITIITIIFPR